MVLSREGEVAGREVLATEGGLATWIEEWQWVCEYVCVSE